MKGNVLLVILLLIFYFSDAQNVPQLQKLKEYVQNNKPKHYDSSLNYLNLNSGGNINYLYPLHQLFRGENKFRLLFGTKGYYDFLAESIAFTGDYQSAIQYAINGYDTVSAATQKQIDKTIGELRNMQHVDARRYISYIAKDHQVIMLNEAHNKPVHRAFAISLLGDLYKKGFRYLAMEMLNAYSNHSLEKLNASTGYYTDEPVSGELVRIALQMGYTLVAYEDTAASSHSGTQRDSVQAENIYALLKKDASAKIFVLAGYAHIAKHALENYIPMALAFKKISGIDPLAVDQTDMSEGSNFEYGRLLYQAYTHKYSITTPSIALMNNEPVNITNNEDYDLAVIHPQAANRDGRPDWLTLEGLRKPLYIKPAEKGTFLVQAYYLDEVGAKGPDQNVPADQSYIPTNLQNYLLYLRKGKYIIVYRDMEYKILGKQNVEVN